MLLIKITTLVTVIYLLVRWMFISYLKSLGIIDRIRWESNNLTPNEHTANIIVGLLRMLCYILWAVDIIYFVFTRF
jgi:hypothetical protein